MSSTSSVERDSCASAFAPSSCWWLGPSVFLAPLCWYYASLANKIHVAVVCPTHQSIMPYLGPPFLVSSVTKRRHPQTVQRWYIFVVSPFQRCPAVMFQHAVSLTLCGSQGHGAHAHLEDGLALFLLAYNIPAHPAATFSPCEVRNKTRECLL